MRTTTKTRDSCFFWKTLLEVCWAGKSLAWEAVRDERAEVLDEKGAVMGRAEPWIERGGSSGAE